LGELAHKLAVEDAAVRAAHREVENMEHAHVRSAHLAGARRERDARAPAFSGRGAPGGATGREMDSHDMHVPLFAAPFGLPIWLFVALCAAAPVLAYAAAAACGLVGGRRSAAALLASAASNSTAKPSRFSPSWQLSRALGGKKKSGLGSSLAALNGQSLKTV